MDESLEEKIESINKMPVWSPVWFKQVAKELLGNDEISLNGKVGRDKEFTITVSCDNDEKFNLFKSFIAEHTFCFGMSIVINRRYGVENKKIIELGEKEQKDLFCIAWLFTNLWEDQKEGKKAHIACETCKYCKECLDSKKLMVYDQFQLITKLTGIKLSAEIGFRKKVEAGEASFIKKDLFKDSVTSQK